MCTLYNGFVADEFHVSFVCQHDSFVNYKNQYLPTYYTIYPQYIKMEVLLSICNIEVYTHEFYFL